MTIQEIKSAISTKEGFTLGTMEMTRQFAEDKVTETEWQSYWNNDKRVRVSMHDDVANKIAADPKGFAGLAFKREEIPADSAKDRAPYVRYIIITPANIVNTF